VLEEKDPSPGVVAQVPSKEGAEKEEEEDTGQDDIMPLLNLFIENHYSLGQR